MKQNEINYHIERMQRKIDRNKRAIERLSSSIAKETLRMDALKKIQVFNPKMEISSTQAIYGELVWKDIPVEGRYITYGKVNNTIQYVEYGSVIIDGKKHRVYKSDPVELCRFDSKYDYSRRNYIFSITIKKSDVWMDTTCMTKIKGIYKRFLKKCEKRQVLKKEDILYEGLEHAPTYIKMLNNFK